MIKKKQKRAGTAVAYQEETVGLPLLIALVVTGLVAVPLLWMIPRINQEGEKTANVSRYEQMTVVLSGAVTKVYEMLTSSEAALRQVQLLEEPKDPILLIEDLPVVDVVEIAPELNVESMNIYWNAGRPLVGIDGETYAVGDFVDGYKITDIQQTKVFFKGVDGQIIAKDMYEDLLLKSRE
jgi:hypothetical protein